MVTFFKNDKGEAGVLIEKLDKNRCVKNHGEYIHLKGSRDYNQYKKIDFTGPIDKDGNPIESPTEPLHHSNLLENAHSDETGYIEK